MLDCHSGWRACTQAVLDNAASVGMLSLDGGGGDGPRPSTSLAAASRAAVEDAWVGTLARWHLSPGTPQLIAADHALLGAGRLANEAAGSGADPRALASAAACTNGMRGADAPAGAASRPGSASAIIADDHHGPIDICSSSAHAAAAAAFMYRAASWDAVAVLPPNRSALLESEMAITLYSGPRLLKSYSCSGEFLLVHHLSPADLAECRRLMAASPPRCHLQPGAGPGLDPKTGMMRLRRPRDRAAAAGTLVPKCSCETA